MRSTLLSITALAAAVTLGGCGASSPAAPVGASATTTGSGAGQGRRERHRSHPGHQRTHRRRERVDHAGPGQQRADHCVMERHDDLHQDRPGRPGRHRRRLVCRGPRRGCGARSDGRPLELQCSDNCQRRADQPAGGRSVHRDRLRCPRSRRWWRPRQPTDRDEHPSARHIGDAGRWPAQGWRHCRAGRGSRRPRRGGLGCRRHGDCGQRVVAHRAARGPSERHDHRDAVEGRQRDDDVGHDVCEGRAGCGTGCDCRPVRHRHGQGRRDRSRRSDLDRAATGRERGLRPRGSRRPAGRAAVRHDDGGSPWLTGCCASTGAGGSGGPAPASSLRCWSGVRMPHTPPPPEHLTPTAIAPPLSRPEPSTSTFHSPGRFSG